MSRLCKKRGFTLLEMMVALGILAVSYVALMEAQSGSIRLSTYGKQITVATFLAQSKMEETDELLTREGFPDMDDEEEGDFEELGYPRFKWRLEVNKVELPLGEAFSQMLSQFGGSDEQGAGGMGGQLGGMMGSGGPGAGIAGMLSPDMLKGQVEMLANMLEQALREVRLTVFWEEGGPGKELTLTTHLVQVPQAPAGPGGTGQTGMPGKSGTPGQPGMPGVGGPGAKFQPTRDATTRGRSGPKLVK